jgi:hypothetical protein
MARSIRDERSVARPDNPWHYGSAAVASFMTKRHVIEDELADPLRLLENDHARNAIESLPEIIKAPNSFINYYFNVTVQTARELAMNAILKEGFQSPHGANWWWNAHPAFDLLERSMMKKCFALDRLPDDDRPGKERWGNRELERFAAKVEMEKPEPSISMIPERLEKSFKNDKPFYHGVELGYIPACISDGRFSEVDSIHLTNGYIKKIENITTKGFPVLDTLDLSDNKIESLDGIDPGLSITHLYLERNNVTSIKGIEKLNQLDSINATHNKILDLDGVKNSSLEILDVSNNGITIIPDLSKHLPKLFTINVQTNNIKNVPSPDYFPDTIYEIDIANNAVSRADCEKFDADLGKSKHKHVNVFCEMI